MNMRSNKIESYVPEKSFCFGKDTHFWSAAFEDCFVVDLHDGPTIMASCRGTERIEASIAEAASLLTLLNGKNEFLILHSSQGTLLVYPAWPHLELALVFLLKESTESVEKAYQNAKRYAFSMIFDAEQEREINSQKELETKLCTLQFYMSCLFGTKSKTDVTAQILMIASLLGCRLHEMSLTRTSVTLNARETEKLGAYLCCAFMTMRRYNGRISTSAETAENAPILTHVPQEYGIRIQQGVRDGNAKANRFDLPAKNVVEAFTRHPAFADYKIEEEDGVFRFCIPLRQKALLSFFPTHVLQNELVLAIFPL